jgi:hypothetical protein
MRELLVSDGAITHLPAQTTTIITVPSPLAPETAAVFDNIAEAVVTTMMGFRYVRDRSWFPSSEAESSALRCPGMMVFRHAKKPKRMILWVPESSFWGMDREVMRSALSLVEHGSTTATAPLTVLGPYYSASASTFAAMLREHASELCYRVAARCRCVPRATRWRGRSKASSSRTAARARSPTPAASRSRASVRAASARIRRSSRSACSS